MVADQKTDLRLLRERKPTMKERFRIHTMRTVKSPSDSSVTTYFIWVNMRDLPAHIPTDVNPASPT